MFKQLGFKQIGDVTNPNSLAARMRKRRFAFFCQLVDKVPRPLSILDVGGRYDFWQRAGFDHQPGVSITLVNVSKPLWLPPHVTFVSGDARSMPQFASGQFDVVFSNSTIEHVGAFCDQKRMAGEVMRVGQRYFVQTPNRYFPIEPHFLFPWFQFLPIPTCVWLLQRFGYRYTVKVASQAAALAIVRSVRLLTLAEMRQLFWNANMYKEYFGGMLKSIVAYKF